MEEIRNYETLLPKSPPDGMIDFLKRNGKLKKHYLIFKFDYQTDTNGKRHRAVRLRCSGCGKTAFCTYIPLGKNECRHSEAKFGYKDPVTGFTITSGDTAECPECGEELRVRHVKDITGLYDTEFAHCLQMYRIGKNPAIIDWVFEKQFHADGETISAHMYEAVVAEERRMIRLSGFLKSLGNVVWFNGWKQRKLFRDMIGAAELVWPHNAGWLCGSIAEKSALEKYLSDCGENAYPAAYLRLWLKYPQVENLVVQGASGLLNDMIENHYKNEAAQWSKEKKFSALPKVNVNWKERRPAQMLGLTKDEFRRCVRAKWDSDALELYKKAKNAGILLSDDDMSDCRAAGSLYSTLEIEKGRERLLLPTVRYLRRQRMRHPETNLNWNYYDDYRSTARLIGLDTGDRHVLFPRDIIAAHDGVQARRREIENQERNAKKELEAKQNREKFAALAERLAPLAWADGGIMIRAAATPDELQQEGKALSHCVGNYISIHAKGNEPIFFVRRTAEPDKPWYTLQLNLNSRTMIQNRGKCNCKETDDVVAFRQKWLAHIQKIRLAQK